MTCVLPSSRAYSGFSSNASLGSPAFVGCAVPFFSMRRLRLSFGVFGPCQESTVVEMFIVLYLSVLNVFSQRIELTFSAVVACSAC